MPFVLERDTTSAGEYVGPVGSKVKLKVIGDTGNAKFVVGAYNGTALTTAEFMIVKGVKVLAVIVQNDVEGDRTGVYEEADAATSVLRARFKFESKWPAVGFRIRGT